MAIRVLEHLTKETIDRVVEAGDCFDDQGVPRDEKLLEIFNTVPAKVTMHSFRATTFYILLSDRCRDFYGLEKNNVSELSSRFYLRTFHPRTFHQFAHTYHFFFPGPKEPLPLTYRLLSAEGKYVAVSGVSQGLRWDEKERLTHILSVTCRSDELPLVNSIVRLGLRELTDRQRQILDLILRGNTNAQIGDELGISPRTVEKHIKVIFDRAGISSRGELLRIANDPTELPLGKS